MSWFTTDGGNALAAAISTAAAAINAASFAVAAASNRSAVWGRGPAGGGGGAAPAFAGDLEGEGEKFGPREALPGLWELGLLPNSKPFAPIAYDSNPAFASYSYGVPGVAGMLLFVLAASSEVVEERKLYELAKTF